MLEELNPPIKLAVDIRREILAGGGRGKQSRGSNKKILGELMNQRDDLRSRYLRDPIPTRLGGLAANLARVASFSQHDGHQSAVFATMHESKWFIEWTAAELSTEETAELVRLQSQLARWEIQSKDKWGNEAWRQDLMKESRRWSDRLMSMSGLLDAS